MPDPPPKIYTTGERPPCPPVSAPRFRFEGGSNLFQSRGIYAGDFSAARSTLGADTRHGACMFRRGVPPEHTVLKGHLPRFTYHQLYYYTKINISQVSRWAVRQAGRKRHISRSITLHMDRAGRAPGRGCASCHHTPLVRTESIPNTVELIPTLGALFPPDEPVQVPVPTPLPTCVGSYALARTLHMTRGMKERPASWTEQEAAAIEREKQASIPRAGQREGDDLLLVKPEATSF